jgi:glycine betaine/proline transport system ATP-binding protein
MEPTAGEVLVGGRDINGLDAAELGAVRSSRIGVAFQTMELLPHRTVLDTVALPSELRGVRRRGWISKRVLIRGIQGKDVAGHTREARTA